MEELRSTEILDKEIEADARKKADKILKNADSEAEKILADVETRVKEAKEQKEKLSINQLHNEEYIEFYPHTTLLDENRKKRTTPGVDFSAGICYTVSKRPTGAVRERRRPHVSAD